MLVILFGLCWISLVAAQTLNVKTSQGITPGSQIRSMAAISSNLFLMASDTFNISVVNRTVNANGDGVYTVWKQLSGHTSNIYSVLSLGTKVLSTGSDALLLVQDYITGSTLSSITLPGGAYDMALDPTNTLVYVAGTQAGGQGWVFVVNLTSQAVVSQFQVGNRNAFKILYDSLGPCLWVGSWDNNVYQVNTSNGVIINTLISHTAAVSYLYQNATHLWSGAEDNTVKLWLKSSPASPLVTYIGFQQRISGIDMNGNWLYAMSWDQTLQAFNGTSKTSTYQYSLPLFPTSFLRVGLNLLTYLAGMSNGNVIELVGGPVIPSTGASVSSTTISTTSAVPTTSATSNLIATSTASVMFTSIATASSSVSISTISSSFSFSHSSSTTNILYSSPMTTASSLSHVITAMSTSSTMHSSSPDPSTSVQPIDLETKANSSNSQSFLIPVAAGAGGLFLVLCSAGGIFYYRRSTKRAKQVNDEAQYARLLKERQAVPLGDYVGQTSLLYLQKFQDYATSTSNMTLSNMSTASLQDITFSPTKIL